MDTKINSKIIQKNNNNESLVYKTKPEVSDNTSLFIAEKKLEPQLNCIQNGIHEVSEKEKKKIKSEKEFRKKLWIRIGIGTAVLVSGLIIADWRRPNSFIKNILKKGFLKTKIGQDIKDGINFAQEAKNCPMEKIPQGDTNIVTQFIDKVTQDGGNICKKIIEDNKFIEESTEFATGKLAENPKILSEIEHAKTTSDAIKSSIELAGTGPTKMAQIISSDTGIMTQIEEKLPDVADAIRSTRSKCSFSRTIEEASHFLEEAFPGKGYVIKKELSAGSIGATYLAQKPDGTEIVVKMIKKGVSHESLQAEQNFFESIIPKITSSAEEAEKMRKMSKDLYSSWQGELNLFQSLQNNKSLAQGATRFSVASIQEVAQNGQCLVMDMAKGIQMNQLVDILTDYKLNPTEFNTKYAALIKANPWLAKPDEVMKKLSPTILQAFDEQFLFVKKNSANIMHADPHTGNFFIRMNEKGKLALEFIDTDNCVLRSTKQIKDDLRMISNYCVGNERKVAEYFINMCECNPAEKEIFIQKVAADIDKYIFSKKTSITDLETFLDNIKIILKKYGLSLSGDIASLKAQIQYLSVANEAAKLSGKNLNIFTIVKDIPKAVISMLKAGINPFSCINDAIKYAMHNVKPALGSSLQFLAA